MGRFKLDEQDKKEPMYISFKPDVYKVIEKKEIKKIAENAVNKEYEKLLKKQ